MKDHVLLSSPRLESINTVFHEGEEEGRYSNLFACFTKCLPVSPSVCDFPPASRLSATAVRGCQPASPRVYKRHQEVSDKQALAFY